MPRINPGPPCVVCGEPSIAKFLCEKHYRRFKKRGTTEASSYGTHGKHELYETWLWTGRGVAGRDPRWETFENFIEDVGPHPGKTSHKFRRVRSKEPFGPTNFYWKELLGIGTQARKNKTAYAKAWRDLNPEMTRNNDLKKMYGISLAEYERMWEAQNGVCYLCQKPETYKIKGKVLNLAVDHCHATGKVRKLLCCNCNQGLGKFGDDMTLMAKGVAYLQEHS